MKSKHSEKYRIYKNLNRLTFIAGLLMLTGLIRAVPNAYSSFEEAMTALMTVLYFWLPVNLFFLVKTIQHSKHTGETTIKDFT